MKQSKLLPVLFILFVFASTVIVGQTDPVFPQPKYPELFKTLGSPVSSKDPLWVRLMYSAEPNFNEVVNAYNEYYKTHPFEKTIHTQNYKHFYRKVTSARATDEQGKVFIDRSYDEIAAQSIKRKQSGSTSVESVLQPAGTESSVWTPLTPFETFRTDGLTASEHVNIYCIAQSRNNANLMYAGSETGALFKSTDKAANWNEVGASVLNYGAPVAIKIDPSNDNKVYVLYDYQLLVTSDGGLNWSVLKSFSRGLDIEVKPDNSNIIFLAGQNGLLRSADGGVSWTTITTQPVSDIEFKSNDPQTVYMAVKNATLNCYVISKSTDGGVNFTEKISGWYSPTGGRANHAEAAKIANTAADPNRLYVLLLGNDIDYNTDLNYIGIYRSSDAGETWTLPYDGNGDNVADNEPGGPYSCTHWAMSTFNVCGGTYDQGFYNADIDVSDTDPNVLLVGMLNLFKSTDGGKTFKLHGGYGCTSCSNRYRHPDIQDILIQGSDVWVTTDGGVDIYDSNLDFSDSKNKGITTCDFWGFDQGWNDDIIVGGRYHNGNMAYYDVYTGGRSLALGGGESATGFVNLGNNRISYFDDLGDGVMIPTTLTGSISRTPPPLLYPNAWGSRVGSEIVNDPRKFNRIFFGKSNKLYVSNDYGRTNTILKEFLPSNLSVRGIEISRRDPNMIFVAVADDNSSSAETLWKTTDGGSTWTNLYSSLPVYTTNAFSFSLNEDDELYISFPGNTAQKVYKSTNFGTTWVNWTTSALNGYSIHDTEVQEGTNGGVYAIANRNVFYRNNTMSDWVDISAGLPVNFNLLEAKPFYRDGKLRIAGSRGVWQRDFYETSVPRAQPMVAVTEVDCGRQRVQFEDYSTLRHESAAWSWSFPGATTVSSTTVRNPVVTYATPGTYSVTLTVTNPYGTSTKTVNNILVVNENKCTVDTLPKKSVVIASAARQYLTTSFPTTKTVTHFTFTGWIKPDATNFQANYSSILFARNPGQTDAITIDFNNSNNQIGTHCGGLWWYNSGLFAERGKWSFVSLIYTPTKVTLVLNEKSYDINGTFPAFEISWIDFGIHNRRNDRLYNGQLEEVKLYDRALTIEELQMMRHIISSDASDPNLFAYYQFNDIFGSTIYDVKNEYDLTLVNAPTIETSTAPVGPGKTQLIDITGAGTYDFYNSGATMTFSGTVHTGKIAVSRLNVSPVNTATNLPSAYSEYWIVDNYRTPTSFSDVSAMTLSSRYNWSSDNAGDIGFYVRDGVDHESSEWVAGASSGLNKPSGVSLPDDPITASSQIYLGRSGETITWTGTNSTNWNDAANWSPNSVPTAAQNVLIPSVANDPVISTGNTGLSKKTMIDRGGILRVDGTLTTTSGVIVSDGAYLIASSANYSGTVTIQKDILAQRGWRIMHNPFASTLSLGTLGSYNSVSVSQTVPSSGISDTRLFDASSGSWVNHTTSIPSATSFALFLRGLSRQVSGSVYSYGPTAFTFEAGGTLKTHPITISPSVISPKFILAGNPMLAPVNSSALTAGSGVPYYQYRINQGNTIAQQRAKTGSWVAMLSSSNTPVPVMGVVAYTPSNLNSYQVSSSDINLTDAPLSGYLTNKSKDAFIQLDLYKEGIPRDRVYLRHSENASILHTDKIDLEKFQNDGTNFYLNPDNTPLAIDARNKWGQPIPLVLKSDTGTYVVTVSENSMPKGLFVILKDNYLNSETILEAGTQYSFELSQHSESQAATRFVLTFRGSLADESSATNKLRIRLIGNILGGSDDLRVEASGQIGNNLSYRIISMNGTVLKSGLINEGVSPVRMEGYATGTYVIQIGNGVETSSLKFIIQ